MSYSLCVDDQHDELPLRAPKPGFVAVKTSNEAWEMVNQRGIPEVMDLDHDLGGEDDIMKFLNRIKYEMAYPLPAPPCVVYVRSRNNQAFDKVKSFFVSWAKAFDYEEPEVHNQPIG